MEKEKDMLHKKIHELRIWKEKPVAIFSVVALVLLVFLCIQILTPCERYEFEGSHAFETGEPANLTVVYEGIHLDPGVYLIDLDYETDTDLGAYCTVTDGTVFTGGLLTNFEHFYSGLGKTDYAFWLFEGTENLQVVVDYGGEGNLSTGNLTIIETNQLWTMLMTIVLFIWISVVALMVFYYYDKKYSVAKEKKHVFFCLTVISLIASVPYLCGYNIAGGDLTYHLMRIEGVKDGLLGGQFPVRIEPRWLYDHGYASAIFYCNTLLYLPAILRILGFTVSASYNIYCIVLNIATVWISYYCFGRIFKNHNIGIVCSALYTLSIFRIFKLTFATVVGEGSAFTFLPLVIYGLYRIFTENPEDKTYKTAWIPVAAGFAGLMQTHVLTCEITAFVTILYCVIYIRKVFRLRTFWELAKGALAAALLSLWFLVPFLDYYLTQDMHIKHVSGRTIQYAGLQFAHLLFHFWTAGAHTPSDGYGVQNSHPVGVGLVLIIGLGVFLILWFSGVFRKQKDTFLSFVKITSLLGMLLLFMSTNLFPWDRIQSLNSVAASLVSSLQFPNRCLGWGTLCLVTVFGYCLSHFETRNLRLYWGMAAIAVIGVTTSGMYLLDFVNSDQNYYELYNQESMGFGYISGREYLIEGTDESLLTFSAPAPGPGVEISDYKKTFLGGELNCINETDTASYVEFPLLLYKGYRAVDTETSQQMQLAAGDNQLVRVLVPANYCGSLQVSFVSPFYWRLAEWITLVTTILLIVKGWRYGRKRLC